MLPGMFSAISSLLEKLECLYVYFPSFLRERPPFAAGTWVAATQALGHVSLPCVWPMSGAEPRVPARPGLVRSPCTASRTAQDTQAGPSVFSGWKFNGESVIQFSLGCFLFPRGFVGALDRLMSILRLTCMLQKLHSSLSFGFLEFFLSFSK